MVLNKNNFTVSAAWLLESDITRIAIRSVDGNTILTRDVTGQHVDKADEQKIQLVFDVLATEIDPSGAIAKANQELVDTQELLKETRDELKRSTDSSELSRKLTMSNSVDIDELFDRVIALEEHAGMHEESEEEDGSTDKTSEEVAGGSTDENNGGNDNGEN